MKPSIDQEILYRAVQFCLGDFGLASCDAIHRSDESFMRQWRVDKYRAIMGFEPERSVYDDKFFDAMQGIVDLTERQELRCMLLLMAAAAWDDF